MRPAAHAAEAEIIAVGFLAGMARLGLSERIGQAIAGGVGDGLVLAGKLKTDLLARIG